MVWLLVVAWFICGFIARGMALAEFTRQYPYMAHYSVARVALISGVLGLIVELLSCDHYEFRLKHLSVEERRKIFCEEFPLLGEQYFNRKHA